MKIYYYKHPSGNVGDDLNPWLWPKLLPQHFSGEVHHQPNMSLVDHSCQDSLFIGIGTLLSTAIPAANAKAVFGSGTGYGSAHRSDNARFYCVRGPLTAQRLELPAKTAITDSAALLATLGFRAKGKKYRYAFMPHHSSAEQGQWNTVCEDLGLHLINPSGTPQQVIDDILQTEVLITEAMHGAIIADTLRTPWIPVKSHDVILDFKWQDWCASLQMEYKPHVLPSVWAPVGVAGKVRVAIKQTMAKRALAKVIATAIPVNSNSVVLHQRIDQLLDALELFKKDFARGVYARSPASTVIAQEA